MNKICIALAALILTGCANVPKTTEELLARSENVKEVETEASVPVSTAFGNMVSKANECWAKENLIVTALPFEKESGRARLSVRSAPALLQETIVFTVVDLRPKSDKATSITARSLHFKDKTPLPGMLDLPNLKQWAEAKEVTCGM